MKLGWILWVAMVIALLTLPGTVSAQVVGTFRWQFAPYCNTVTLLVEQKGSGYVLTGTDDLCGGSAVLAAASGTAHMNPNGTVTLAITVTRPDGIAVIHSARLALPSLGGPWSDNFGNSGTFIFNPPNPSGPRRPVTKRGNYAVDFLTYPTLSDGVGASAFSYGITLASAPVPHLLPPGATTVECPGNAANPQAAPGHLCVYTGVSQRIRGVCIASMVGPSYVCNAADRSGAAVVVLDTEPAGVSYRVFHVGTWAVTIPE